MNSKLPANRSDILIETVEVVDQALINCLQRLYGQLYPDLSRSQVESRVRSQTLTELIESPTDTLLVVKTPKNHITGMATLNLVYQMNGRFAQIECFVIDRDCRRQGLGSLLLDKLLELAAEQQVRVVGLISGKHRRESHRLYEGAGFRQPDVFYYSRQLSDGRT